MDAAPGSQPLSGLGVLPGDAGTSGTGNRERDVCGPLLTWAQHTAALARGWHWVSGGVTPRPTAACGLCDSPAPPRVSLHLLGRGRAGGVDVGFHSQASGMVGRAGAPHLPR